MRQNPQETADLVTFAEEIFNGKLHFLCSVEAATSKCFTAWNFINKGQLFYLIFVFSKSTIEALEKGVNYVQS